MLPILHESHSTQKSQNVKPLLLTASLHLLSLPSGTVLAEPIPYSGGRFQFMLRTAVLLTIHTLHIRTALVKPFAGLSDLLLESDKVAGLARASCSDWADHSAAICSRCLCIRAQNLGYHLAHPCPFAAYVSPAIGTRRQTNRLKSELHGLNYTQHQTPCQALLEHPRTGLDYPLVTP